MQKSKIQVKTENLAKDGNLDNLDKNKTFQKKDNEKHGKIDLYKEWIRYKEVNK